MTKQLPQETDYARFRTIHLFRKIALVWNIASTTDELHSTCIVPNLWDRPPVTVITAFVRSVIKYIYNTNFEDAAHDFEA